MSLPDVKWIKITTDIFDDDKIIALETFQDGYVLEVIWFKILCLAGTCNENGLLLISQDIPYTDEMLAKRFRIEVGIIKRALEIFQKLGMVSVESDIYMVSNWLKYQNKEGLDKIREQNRIRQKRHREKLKKDSNVTGNVTDNVKNNVNCSYSLSNKHNIDNLYIDNIYKHENADKDVNSTSPDEFFERIWKIYPVKKGKASVSKKQKKKLMSIGFDKIKRCVDRYLAELEASNTDRKFWKHGSTFFNSGYVDYLDENYEAETEKPEKQPLEIDGEVWQ